MTKAEIIRKLAKRAGISDLDAKVFFEAFLRKAVLRLNPGDSVKVKGFGYFQRRTGKVKNHADTDISKALADLIVFYPFRSENEDGNENLIFNVPERAEEEYNIIDSYFSISFGKPVIPLKDANLSEFYIPPVGNELIRLIESRAEKLLDETEVVENYIKGNELLLIDAGILNPNQMEINWDESNIARGATGEIFAVSEEQSNDISDKITWDFGEDLDKQIQEESILDTGSEDKLFVDYDDLKGISWEFGQDEEKEKEPFKPIVTEEEPKKEYEKPEIKESAGEEAAKEEAAEEPDEFKRVKSFTSKHNIDQNNFGLTKSEMDLSWTFGQDDADEDSALLKSITQEINEEGFAEIKQTRRKYKFETDIKEPSEEEQKQEPLSGKEIITETEPEREQEFEREQEPEPEPEIDVFKKQKYVRLPETEFIPEPEEEGDKAAEIYPKIPERTPSDTKKKGLGIFVISALVLVLCGAVLIYVKMSHFIGTSHFAKKTEAVRTNVSSVTIERDFDIPVTYPYMQDNSVKPPIDPFTGNLSTTVESKENQTQGEQPPAEKETPKVETKSDGSNYKPIKLKEFIFQSGDKYLVQVSSWPTEPAALKHASYFKNKGFDTEIEKAYLGKGYWYRVRVGYFKSESEAENFYNKYK